MKRGLDWYKREPRAIIDAKRKARMTARQAAIYDLVLDLIYEGGGETPDAPQYFAGHFSDIGTAAARRAIEDLIGMGKLIREGDMLTNSRAKNEAKTRRKLSETRAEIGRIGGISSGKSRAKSNDINVSHEANASSKHEAEVEREKDKKESAYALSGAREAKPDPFDTFWAVYPKRVERKGAEKKFRAAVKAGAPPERIIDGARRYAQSDAVRRGYVKNPTTWLNNGCWDDEPDQPGLIPLQSNRSPEDERFARLMDFAQRRDERRAAEQRMADGPRPDPSPPLLGGPHERGRGTDDDGGLAGCARRSAAGGDREGDPWPDPVPFAAAAYAWRG